MTQTRASLIALSVAAAALAGALALPRPLGALDLHAYDLLLPSDPQISPSTRVAIVAIDDRSLAAVGRWPWPRDVIARLVTRLRESGAAGVVLDILFSEPEADRWTTGPVSGEAALADAIRPGDVVLGYAMAVEATSGPSCEPPTLAATLVSAPGSAGPRERLFEASGVLCSTAELASAAPASGFLNVTVDTDGRLRRLPLVMGHKGHLHPSLALTAALRLLGNPPVSVEAPTDRPLRLTIGTRRVDLDERGTAALRFRGRRDRFTPLSAVDVLNWEVPTAAIANRLVVVGVSATGIHDVVPTPTRTQLRAVEVQATAIENLLDGTFVTTPAFARGQEFLVGVVAALLVALANVRYGGAGGFAAAAIAVGAAWLSSGWLLRQYAVFLSPLLATVGGTGAAAGLAVVSVWSNRTRRGKERQRRRQAHEFVVKSLTAVMEMRDASTGRHSRRTQGYSRLLARRLAQTPGYRDYLTDERVEWISLLAPLHDIGKVGVRDAVLNKPGALTPDEFAEMRRHPVYGFETISETERQVGIDSAEDAIVLSLAKDIVYTHHERWDGRGYPRGLRGEDIPVAGRIMAVVDMYDALVEPRPYRPPLPHKDATDLIAAGRGTQFDPAVVEAFMTVEPEFLELSARLRDAAV